MAFGWQDLLIWGLGILATGFSIWLTALLSFRASVRQKVWQQVFEEKWATVLRFTSAMDRFSDLVYALRVTASLSSNQAGDALPRVRDLLEMNFPEKAGGDRVETLNRRMSQPVEAQADQAARLVAVLSDLRDILLYGVRRAHHEMLEAYSRLLIVGYDPGVARKMERHAADELQRLVREGLPYETFDFKRFDREWRPIARQTKLRLRKDLVASSRSLSWSLRIARGWVRSVETGKGL